MKKLLLLVLGIVLLVCAVFAAYRFGWMPASVARLIPPPATAPAASGSPSASGNPAGTPGSPAAPQGATAPAALPPFEGNVASLDWGGNVESVTGAEPGDNWSLDLIDNNPDTSWYSGEAPGPREIVLSFYRREPVLIEAVAFLSTTNPTPRHAPRDIEVWTSMTGPSDGFTKVASGALPPNDETTLKFAPVEARFVKVRLLHNHEGGEQFNISELKVLEAARAGYTSMVARHPEIAAPVVAAAAGAVPIPASLTMPGCSPTPDPPQPPGHAESRRVLVLTPSAASAPKDVYDGFRIKDEDPDPNRRTGIFADLAILDRTDLTLMVADRARPNLLAPQAGYDTVAMEQVCDDTVKVSPAFKQALVAWVAAGHKLIIHDADKCSPGPDYSFLPFRFKTSNPGAQGAEGSALRFIEENWMTHGRTGRPGFIDVDAWMASTDGYRNELGDSNTVMEWDPHWCGHMTVRNVNGVYGFVSTYAHHGRGLIIYSGFDIDMKGSTGYDLVIARELAQGFDPDNLPCAARLGDFVLTTDAHLTDRPVVPGRSYSYPLTLLSNQGYKGTINLAIAATPGMQGLQSRFEPTSVPLTNVAEAALTVTLPAGVAPTPQALAVTGTDAAGKTNTLCLRLNPPRAGELSVVSTLGRPPKVRKNLEIILDASGSMKTVLGKKSRWTTALDTLKQVLDKLPDDFNVGLRIYGHREASTSPKTCTDSELVVPIDKIDRTAVFNAANAVKPRGETPLVYSVLQAPADLKAVGGGTVILITDGEESCHGDARKAAADLKASGLDITLNIVGFTVTNQKTQGDLSGFAKATGGRFYQAQSGAALAQAVLVAAIDKFPYTVYDAAGKVAATGEAGGPAEELPPGDYKVVVRAGNEELVISGVRVTLGQEASVRLVNRNDKLVLEK